MKASRIVRVKSVSVFIGASAALMSAFTANAQAQAGARACSAVIGDLQIPVVVMMQDAKPCLGLLRNPTIVFVYRIQSK